MFLTVEFFLTFLVFTSVAVAFFWGFSTYFRRR